MAGPSNYLADKMINHLMGGAAGAYVPTSPAFLRLYSANPDFDAGTGGTQMVATGYTAGGQSTALTAANWNAAAAGTPNGKMVDNIVVPSWTAGAADWEEITGAAFWDNAGTNMLFGKALDTPRTPGNGDTFRFSAGAIEFALDQTTAAGISDFWKAEILDHVMAYATRAYTAPTTAYLALFTENPDWQTGATYTEVAAGDYARKSITMGAAIWTLATGGNGLVTNTAEIAFAAATSDWGTIIGAALVSTVSGAFDLFAGDDFTGVAIGNGDTFKIAAGDFDVSLL